MTEELKKPGYTYFGYENESLFGSVEASVSLTATDFPIFPKDASLLETAVKGSSEWKKSIKDCVGLTVTTRIAGSTTGGTIILTEEEQDNLILGILERRGLTKAAKLLERIAAEVPQEGIQSDKPVKSKFCPAKSSRLPGEGSEEEDAKKELKIMIERIRTLRGQSHASQSSGFLNDLFEALRKS